MRKNSGVAPSVAAVLDKCPQAAGNPGTGEPFTPKHTYEAFRSYCYDEGSVVPGDHQDPVQKTAPTQRWRPVRLDSVSAKECKRINGNDTPRSQAV